MVSSVLILLSDSGFDSTAARFLTAQRQVLGVGIDTLSIDRGVSRVSFIFQCGSCNAGINSCLVSPRYIFAAFENYNYRT